MAKVKSLKLRTIASVCILYKHSDKNHRMTFRRMAPFLKPYGLQTSGPAFSDDIRNMQKFGLDIKTNDGVQICSACIDEHLISDENLRKLIFAVSTNPYINQSQATQLLQQLKPLVTVYQESLLQSFLHRPGQKEPDDSLYWAYLVAKEAIETNRRIMYTTDYVKLNNDSKKLDLVREWETLFTPQCLLKASGKLYILGYNNDDKKTECLDLTRLATIRLAREYKQLNTMVQQQKKAASPQDSAKGSSPTLYEGPAEFRCSASNVSELYNLFGEPTERVKRAHNYQVIYPIEHVIITTEVLTRLAGLSVSGGMKIIGPEGFRSAVEAYYDSQEKVLLSKKFPRRQNNNRHQTCK